MTPEREAFEDWAKRHWADADPGNRSFAIWQAALAWKAEQAQPEPFCQFVKADNGNYPVLHWRTGYVAKIGDKFYLNPPTQGADMTPVHVHDWVIWPETDGLEQRCKGCGEYRSTPEDEKFWLRTPTKQTQPEPVAWTEHELGIIADIEAMAKATGEEYGFWPKALAAGVLRMLRKEQAQPEPLTDEEIDAIPFEFDLDIGDQDAGNAMAEECRVFARMVLKTQKEKAPTPCAGNDPLCPCQDGDSCHYQHTKKTKAWKNG